MARKKRKYRQGLSNEGLEMTTVLDLEDTTGYLLRVPYLSYFRNTEPYCIHFRLFRQIVLSLFTLFFT
jgi:hypothetical protein